MNISEILFSLLSNEMAGMPLHEEIKETINDELLLKLYKLSKSHDLAHLVGDALDKNDLFPAESKVRKSFIQERNMAVYRYEQINYELQEICRALEENKIKHIPLKGSVIRKYYPAPWMRTSCDIDILIHKEDLDNAIAVLSAELKYKHEYGCFHDESLYSEGGVHLELHHTLLEDAYNPNAAQILESVWADATPKSGYNYLLELSNEMFYFYHIVHMAKHFINGGCGIKPFLDIIVIENNMCLNPVKCNELLNKGNLLKFSDNAKKLANVWFKGAERDEMANCLEEYVLHGGVYGTLKNKVVAQQAQRGGKFRYALTRIFQPYEQLKQAYPIITKHKWLMPFYQVVRWFRIIFKGNVKKSMQELSMNATVGDETRERTKELLNELGLE